MLLSIIVLPGKNTRHLLNKEKECMSMVGWFTKDLKICSILVLPGKNTTILPQSCRSFVSHPTMLDFFSFVEKVSGSPSAFPKSLYVIFSLVLIAIFATLWCKDLGTYPGTMLFLLALLVCFVFSLSVYFLLFQFSFTKYSSSFPESLKSDSYVLVV